MVRQQKCITLCNSSLLLFVLLVFRLVSSAQTPSGVQFSGSMRETIREGKLAGTIDLDTISELTNLFGLGPMEYLKGEITVLDGIVYKSEVVDDSTQSVNQTYSVRAPFFVYSYVRNWISLPLPDSVNNTNKLEQYLNFLLGSSDRARTFKLQGLIDSTTIHIVNLPDGTQLQDKESAHTGMVKYKLHHTPCTLLGYYSKNHEGIFTHHGSSTHIHLISDDKRKMGHLEEAHFLARNVTLYLAIQ